MYYSLFEMVRHKKNWDTEDGEASEQLYQKRNSFYLKITLEVSFFFSFEKKECHKASMDDFKSSVYSFAKIIFLTNDKEHCGKEVVSKQKILFLKSYMKQEQPVSPQR